MNRRGHFSLPILSFLDQTDKATSFASATIGDWSRMKNPSVGKMVERELLGKKQVEFTAHAIEQMKNRSIQERQVYLVLEEPAQTGLPVRPSRKRKRVRGEISRYKSLDVIYELRKDRVLIITAVVIQHKRRTRRR